MRNIKRIFYEALSFTSSSGTITSNLTEPAYANGIDVQLQDETSNVQAAIFVAVNGSDVEGDGTQAKPFSKEMTSSHLLWGRVRPLKKGIQ